MKLWLGSLVLKKLWIAFVMLAFVTAKENWNEELLLQFYATLHIRGYNRDPKTRILEWMTGDVHHEDKA